jgi:hypothetical protein
MQRIRRLIPGFFVLLWLPDCLANATLHWNDTLENKAGLDNAEKSPDYYQR